MLQYTPFSSLTRVFSPQIEPLRKEKKNGRSSGRPAERTLPWRKMDFLRLVPWSLRFPEVLRDPLGTRPSRRPERRNMGSIAESRRRASFSFEIITTDTNDGQAKKKRPHNIDNSHYNPPRQRPDAALA